MKIISDLGRISPSMTFSPALNNFACEFPIQDTRAAIMDYPFAVYTLNELAIGMPIDCGKSKNIKFPKFTKEN